MRRFLITSPNYTGQAEVIFNDAGTLCRMDVTDTNMPAAMVSGFKNRLCAHVDQLPDTFKGTAATVIEADFEVSFDMFWKKYNKKINKSRCILLWGKMDKSMQVMAFMGIDLYDKYLKKVGWRSKADAETYLRNKYWENEYGPTQPPRGGAATEAIDY